MRATLPSLAIALLASSCGAPEQPGGAEAPVDVVRQALGEGRPLSVTEELRVGGGGDASFYLIRGAALDDAGYMYVLDAGNHRVAVFDPDGRLVRTFGQEGQGPGDFVSPSSMWLAGDTLAVSDQGNRLHFFLTDGTHVRTRAYLDLMSADDQWRTGGIVGTPEGWMVSASAFFQSDPRSPQSSPPMPRTRLFAVAPDGGLESTGLYWERELEGRWDGVYFVTAPFAYSPRSAVDGLGRMHVAMTGDYVVELYDAGGAPIRRVENEVPRIPVEGAMLDRWRKLRGCRPGQPECSEARTELALSLPRAELVPVVDEIRGFVGGYTAVRRAATDPDPADTVIQGDYDFFAPNGRYIGTLAAGPSPRWFDGETLLATEWDEDQVATMVRYRVDVPADGG